MTGESRTVLGTRVDAATLEGAAERVCRWARHAESRYVCCANVHMVMEGHDDPAFRAVVNGADLVTADGMPLAWALRLRGVRAAPRVYGPALMLAVCARAEAGAIPVGLYGGAPEALAALEAALARRFPRLRVAYRASPPFRALSPAEREAARREIAASGARILFVGLGCPRQERWMAGERGHVPAVMLGVGAAFDFLSGRKRQAPAILGRLGLEWAFRLATEPRRLWRRYLKHNPRFVVLLARQLARAALRRAEPAPPAGAGPGARPTGAPGPARPDARGIPGVHGIPGIRELHPDGGARGRDGSGGAGAVGADEALRHTGGGARTPSTRELAP